MTYVFGNRQIFGRESELATLQQAYDRVSKTGYGEIVLVGGPAGFGKTSVVNAFLAGKDNLKLAIGKADESLRRVPYSTILKALSWILSAEEIDGITRVGEVSAFGAPSRVKDRLVDAIQSASSPSRPFVFFVDDLHWLDPSSVRVMRTLSERGLRDILVIATYRTDDLKEFSENGLASFLGNTSVRVTDVLLRTLPYDAVEGLISSQRYGDTSKSLARLVQSVAGGNPFHIQLILNVLDQAETTPDLAQFVSDQKNWGLYSLLGRIFAELPAKTRSVLKAASCVGFQSDHAVLAAVADVPVEWIERLLAPVVSLGLVRSDSEACQFSHDAVREHIRKGLSKDERTTTHALIVKSLLVQRRDGTDHRLALAEQIVKAKDSPILLASAAEVIEALFSGARIAKAVGSPEAGLRYIDRAIEHAAISGQTDDLRWDLAELRCAILIELHGSAIDDNELAQLVSLAGSALRHARATRLRAAVLILRGQFEDAIDLALSGLEWLGIRLSRRPSKSEQDVAYEATMSAIERLSLPDIGQQPVVTDETVIVAMDLLATLQSSFFSNDGLKFVHSAKIVELSAAHGVSEATCYGLAWCGVCVASQYADYPAALAMAEAAVALSHERSFQAYRTSALVALDQVSVWVKPLSYALSRAKEAFENGKNNGDIAMACYATNHIVSDLLSMGAPISVVANEANRGLAMARTVGFGEVIRILEVQLQFVNAIRDNDVSPGTIVGLARSNEASEMSPLIFWGHLFEGITAFYHGHYEAAVKSFDEARTWTWTTPAHIHIADLHFYAALSKRLLGTTSDDCEDMAALERFALYNPTTFANKVALVDAETARLSGNLIEALKHYEQSVQAARDAGLSHELAVAHERAGRTSLEVGLVIAAKEHLRLAQQSYTKWGAKRHAERLQEEFGDLLQTAPDDGADERTVRLSASDEWMTELVVAATRYSGALRGQLVAVSGNELFVVANASLHNGKADADSGPLDTSGIMPPASIIRLVKETAHSLRYGHASVEAGTGHGSSFQGNPVKSLLCVPLKERDRVFSVLYLENNAINDAFSYEDEQAIELFVIATAQAILLKAKLDQQQAGNAAQLYRESELVSARADLIKNSHMTVLGGMAASIAHEVNQPLSAIVTHANAGLRWLRQSIPQIENATNNFLKIEQSSLRASSIIQALRSLAKQSPANLEFLDLNEVVRDVLEVVATDSRAEGVEVECQLTEGASLFADSIQIQQVVLNLMTNALDAMEGQVAPRRLTITSETRDAFVVLAVSDTGSGIPQAARDSIFDPFFTTKGHGLGMGLAICKTIAEVHGGGLSIGSSSSAGTIMIFNLPITSNP